MNSINILEIAILEIKFFSYKFSNIENGVCLSHLNILLIIATFN